MDAKSTKQKKKMNWDILSSIFIYLWAGLFFVASLSIKDRQSQIFPWVMCAIAVVLSTIFLITNLTGKHKKENKEDADLEAEEADPFKGSGRSAIMGGILILYILANYLTGFYISTNIFLPCGMLYLGQRNWKPIVFVTVGLNLIIWVFFDLILKMQMPKGILF